MNVHIYCLSDPETGMIRYVGKTHLKKNRYSAHCNDKSSSHKANWIRGLLSRGVYPVMEDLEVIENSNDEDWQEAERFWIEYLRFLGFKLCNSESGGLGGKKLNRDVVERIASKTRGQIRGPHSESHRRKIGLAKLGGKCSPEHCRKNGIAHLGMRHSEKTKEILRSLQKGIPKTAEHRAKISAGLKGRKVDEAQLIKMRQLRHTDEAKARISAANRGRKHTRSPEYLAKLRAAMALYNQKRIASKLVTM